MDEMPMSGEEVGNSLTFPKLFAWTGLLVKSPRTFFAQMAKTGGYVTPMLFSLFWFFVATLLELILSHVRPQPVQFGWAVELVWLIVGPVIFLLTGFIAAGVFFVIWHLMGSQQNYQTAFRCWAFTTPLAVLSAVLGLVPYLNILGLLYGMYLLVIASIVVHGISSKRSWTVWGTICVVLIAILTVSEVARRYLQRQGYDANSAGAMSGMANDDTMDQDLDNLSVSTASASAAPELPATAPAQTPAPAPSKAPGKAKRK